MNRSDLAARLAVQFEQLQRSDVESCVDTLLGAMSDAMVQSGRVEIRGFGSFSTTDRAERIGRNPRAGASVKVPSTRNPRFKPGKALRQRVDG